MPCLRRVICDRILRDFPTYPQHQGKKYYKTKFGPIAGSNLYKRVRETEACFRQCQKPKE